MQLKLMILNKKFNEKAENLLSENEALNQKIKELAEKIDLQEAVIKNFKSILKCDKCAFQAENLNEFNVHLSVCKSN